MYIVTVNKKKYIIIIMKINNTIVVLKDNVGIYYTHTYSKRLILKLYIHNQQMYIVKKFFF